MIPAMNCRAIQGHLRSLLTVSGSAQYGGEAVSQLEHALQCAHAAEDAGEAAPLIVASLLHDVGHLLESDFNQALTLSHDLRHEAIGAQYLRRVFPVAVTEPIRLHVVAKRYLCSVRPSYLTTLSEASLHSLSLQGGPLDDSEVRQFESEPFHRQAIRLREYDDRAKCPGAMTPDLDHFLQFIDLIFREQAAPGGTLESGAP